MALPCRTETAEEIHESLCLASPSKWLPLIMFCAALCAQGINFSMFKASEK